MKLHMKNKNNIYNPIIVKSVELLVKKGESGQVIWSKVCPNVPKVPFFFQIMHHPSILIS